MSNILITFSLAIIIFFLFRWINNYIQNKYTSSPYKNIAYILLFIGGSLVVFTFLSLPLS